MHYFVRVVNLYRTLLVPGLGFDSLYDLEYSPYDKDGKRDEKDHAEPIHRPMERLYE